MPESAVVRYALSAVGCPYIYGATGRPCAPDYRRALLKQYPRSADNIRRYCPILSGKAVNCSRCAWKGRPAYDCAQLVRRALARADVTLPSGASSQWRAPTWALKTSFNLPIASRFVCVLFRADPDGYAARPMAHVGISLGDGTAVDARNHAKGVIHTRLTAYPWTHMAFPVGFSLPGRPPGLSDVVPGSGQDAPPADAAAGDAAGPGPDPGAPPASSAEDPGGSASEPLSGCRARLARGMKGERVKTLQETLLRLGFSLPRYGADGVFGGETAAALRAFQLAYGFPPTGEADCAILDALQL